MERGDAPRLHFLGLAGEQVQLPGVAGPGSGPTGECSRGGPSLQERLSARRPGAADVSLASAPGRHPALGRLSCASPWGPELHGGMNGALWLGNCSAKGSTGDVGMGEVVAVGEAELFLCLA